jgi:hydrogenase nickel incorporation protein HypB
MCVTCGCSGDEKVTITDEKTGDQKMISHSEAHKHGHTHDHSHATAAATSKIHSTTIELEQQILGKNQLIAEQNRAWFADKKILALNLVSSPGSGKTTLLERTINDLKNEFEIGVIEGDQETINDAERIRATGCKAVQINTGTGCHLEAEMLKNGLDSLNPSNDSLLFIENVGNLVCPAMFDLGERMKVAILSVTEGEDKPLKYPHMFRASDIMLLNKIDLLPYVKFNVERSIEYAKEVNPKIEVIQVSATSGEGMDIWYEKLREMLRSN